jgi:multidrug resistance efflux pump
VSVNVKLFETVKRGQTVAVLDIVRDDKRIDEQLKSQLETITAEIGHLTAQLAPTREQILADVSQSETSRAKDLRQFASDVDDIRLRVLQLRATIETERMAAQTLDEDIATTRKLVDANAVVPDELKKLVQQYAAAQTSVQDSQTQLDQAQKNLESAQQRMASFVAMAVQHPSADSAMEVIRKQIEVQERLMNEVSTQLAMLRSQQAFELKSPFDGVVSSLALDVGDVADVNVPVLKIAQSDPTEVLGYIDESQASQIREGVAVEVVRRGPPAAIARGEVVSVGPVVEQLPMQLWRARNTPQWGRPFLVRASADMKLLTGEKVGIRRL